MIRIPLTKYIVLRKTTFDEMNNRLFGMGKQIDDLENMLVEAQLKLKAEMNK